MVFSNAGKRDAERFAWRTVYGKTQNLMRCRQVQPVNATEIRKKICIAIGKDKSALSRGLFQLKQLVPLNFVSLLYNKNKDACYKSVRRRYRLKAP
jgi:hypothetical protein